MRVEIIARPAFTVVGLKYRGRNEHEEIPALWGQFMPHLQAIEQRVNDAVFYGVIDHFDPATGEYDYLAAVEATPGAQPPAGLERWEIPAATYAVFSFPFGGLMPAIDYANHTWLPGSTYQRAAGPEFEYYPATFEPEDMGSEMQQWIPVQTK
jgi:AraC family transcriptional regulator